MTDMTEEQLERLLEEHQRYVSEMVADLQAQEAVTNELVQQMNGHVEQVTQLRSRAEASRIKTVAIRDNLMAAQLDLLSTMCGVPAINLRSEVSDLEPPEGTAVQ